MDEFAIEGANDTSFEFGNNRWVALPVSELGPLPRPPCCCCIIAISKLLILYPLPFVPTKKNKKNKYKLSGI